MWMEQKAEGGPFCPVCLVQDTCFGLASSITGVYSHYTVSSLETKVLLLPTDLYPYLNSQNCKQNSLAIEALSTIQNKENEDS